MEIVAVGKQLLMTRGSLTTFSLANDVSKYFAIVPAAFGSIYPQLKALDIMRLHSPTTAVLAAVAFNALVIVGLVPMALKGVQYRPLPAAVLRGRAEHQRTGLLLSHAPVQPQVKAWQAGTTHL